MLVAGSVVSTASFSALAARDQPGRSKTQRISVGASVVLPRSVSRAGATVGHPAISDPASSTTTVGRQQTAGSQDRAGVAQLPPPTTTPDTVPAPVNQATNPSVVLSGAS